jgi:hypothetical protein
MASQDEPESHWQQILIFITTTILPLLGIFVQFSAPLTSISTHCLTIIHLIGDPIDAVASLLFSLRLAQKHAEYFDMLSSEGAEGKLPELIRDNSFRKSISEHDFHAP